MTPQELMTAADEIHNKLSGDLRLIRGVAARKESLLKDHPSEQTRRELGSALDQAQTRERWLHALVQLKELARQVGLSKPLPPLKTAS